MSITSHCCITYTGDNDFFSHVWLNRSRFVFSANSNVIHWRFRIAARTNMRITGSGRCGKLWSNVYIYMCFVKFIRIPRYIAFDNLIDFRLHSFDYILSDDRLTHRFTLTRVVSHQNKVIAVFGMRIKDERTVNRITLRHV